MKKWSWQSLLFLLVTFLSVSPALAQSDLDEDEWLPYESSDATKTKPQSAPDEKKTAPAPEQKKAAAQAADDDKQSSKAKQPRSDNKPQPTKADHSDKPAASLQSGPIQQPAQDKPPASTTAKDSAETKTTDKETSGDTAGSEQGEAAAPAAKKTPDKSQTQPPRTTKRPHDEPQDQDEFAESDDEVSVFNTPTAIDSSLGCLAGSCLPDVSVLTGANICGLSILAASTSSGFDGLGYLIIGIVFGGGGICLGSACLGPMSSVAAMIGGAVAASADQRPLWIPLAGGSPGLLLGLLGSAMLLVPVTLVGIANPSNFDPSTANLIGTGASLLMLGGFVSALAAGPLSVAGIIIADSIWGANQQSEVSSNAEFAQKKALAATHHLGHQPQVLQIDLQPAQRSRSSAIDRASAPTAAKPGFAAAY